MNELPTGFTHSMRMMFVFRGNADMSEKQKTTNSKHDKLRAVFSNQSLKSLLSISRIFKQVIQLLARVKKKTRRSMGMSEL